MVNQNVRSGGARPSAKMQYANFEDGVLIPFDAFYRTVETFLDHNIRKVILDAEESAERGGALQAYDVEVLKVLFMVKYIPRSIFQNCSGTVRGATNIACGI